MRHAPAPLPDPELWARCFGATYPARFAVGEHSHTWDQLTLTESGIVRVIAAGRAWLVPPQHALWVPAQTPHDLVTFGPVALRTLYFHPGTVRSFGSQCHALETSPLLRELALHAVRRGRLRRSDNHESTCLRLLRDLLAIKRPAEFALRLPADPRGIAAARLLFDDPNAGRDIGALARRVGASRRTLERIFVRQTGVSIGRWRQRLQLLGSLPHLSEGVPIGRVAEIAGYASASAFGARFRRTFGVTPRRFAMGDAGNSSR